MELSVLSLKDREIITALFRDVFTHTPWNDDWSNEAQLDAYITDLAGQHYSLTLGYFDSGRLVGLSMGYVKHWHAGTEYIINEFCVDRQLQGTGIGTGFLKAVESYLSAHGIHHIFLLTDRDVPACSFYRHNGFTELTGTVAFSKALRPEPAVEFRRFTEFPRGTMYDILKDAYSFDKRNRQIWDANWKESDSFFYDHPEIADKYGLVTCLGNEPIGFVCWDPRNSPDYVEIGHNGIREIYKGRGYGRLQLEEALRRIRKYEGLKRIIVCTNSNLIAPRNYEAAGFVLYGRKPNETESAFTGDYLYYEIVL